MKRRNFVKNTASGAAIAAAGFNAFSAVEPHPLSAATAESPGNESMARMFNAAYTGSHLDRVAFPLGGIGAGMVCLEGCGALSHVSLRNHPDVFNEPLIFSALYIKGMPNIARVLEGPLPGWKAFGYSDAGNGAGGKTYGLPRFDRASFSTRFPFAELELEEDKIPLKVRITGWSPFIPLDPDNSSLPAAALEFTFKNVSARPVEAVYSFNARNFMARSRRGAARTAADTSRVGRTDGGFILQEAGSEKEPWQEGSFCALTDQPGTAVNCRWFRGGWWDPLTIAWKDVEAGAAPERSPLTEGHPSPGGSLYVPFSLAPGEEKKINLLLCWYVPKSDMREGPEVECSGGDCCSAEDVGRTFSPWYAKKFKGIEEVADYWKQNYSTLRERSAAFSETFYASAVPPEALEAVAANLTILKSPTVLRQIDGSLWCWEGCSDDSGCCQGSCTHVWNYAQALPHLFPTLERSLRHTEFFVDQDKRGHQAFRASLPIRHPAHEFHAAADGQLGGIMKAFREWRISGDSDWLKKYWPRINASLDYCILTWDPRHHGTLEEPHHNTYDIEFWGPDAMCTSFYLGALKAAGLMAAAVGEKAPLYRTLYEKGRKFMETELFNGEYFYQKVQLEGLDAKPLSESEAWNIEYSPEAQELLKKEGPKYQYGTGCLSDGVLGVWIAAVCGVGEILDLEKVKSHLAAVHKYNFKKDLSEHANPQRPSYALGKDGGLLLCSWPRGGKPSLPFVYSDEVWTGIEYQVASHLMLVGLTDQGLEIVRAARERYDGRLRNPFNEYECGHWYARAMASYGLLQGLSGILYDARDKVLYIHPTLGGDFACFISTATGYGLAGVRGGKPFVEAKEGKIEISKIDYRAAV